MIEAGDFVLLHTLPAWVEQLPEESQEVISYCVGHTFRVEEIDRFDHLVLDVSPLIDKRFGGFKNDIRIEPIYVRAVLRDSEFKPAIIRWSLQSAAGVVGYAALLFLAAGRLDWLWGWVFIALLAAALLGHVIVLVPTNPALLAERQKGMRRDDAPRWDRWIAALGAGLMPFLSWIIAGLNVRFGWEAPIPAVLHLIGLALGVAGWGLFLWAIGSNAFFSEAVRIQTERGHSVQASGPYRFVRHPGYLGACLTFLGTPLLLGSRWALIPTLIGVSLYVLRTALEDRFLHENLDGYSDFARETRYRLIPGLW